MPTVAISPGGSRQNVECSLSRSARRMLMRSASLDSSGARIGKLSDTCAAHTCAARARHEATSLVRSCMEIG